MSATLGYILLMILSLLIVAYTVLQLTKATIKTVEILDKYIKKIEKEEPIADELKHIKGFMITVEKKLYDVEEAITEIELNSDSFSKK